MKAAISNAPDKPRKANTVIIRTDYIATDPDTINELLERISQIVRSSHHSQPRKGTI